MIAQRVWALINENEVKNAIVCDNYPTASMLAKNSFGDVAIAVEITQIPAAIGHVYEDGFFKDSEGNIIEPLPTAEEEVAHFRHENEGFKKSQSEQDDIITDLLIGGM